jgi:hypothetical protein
MPETAWVLEIRLARATTECATARIAKPAAVSREPATISNLSEILPAMLPMKGANAASPNVTTGTASVLISRETPSLCSIGATSTPKGAKHVPSTG